MTETARCPCCGSELPAKRAAVARAKATGIADRASWLQHAGKPRTIAAMMKATPKSGPTWWLPSLAYMAYPTASDGAKAVLDEFARRRSELGYAVVEEMTDDVVGFSIQPWPVLDERGRLRFPIDEDPIQLELGQRALTELMTVHRTRWHALGLLQAELVERQVQIGDTFAMAVATKPDGSKVLALPQSDDDDARYIGGLEARKAAKAVSVPIVDITWDAREAGKLAHYAAAAGVVVAEAPEPAMLASVEETEARYMVGYAEGKDPRDVTAEEATS